MMERNITYHISEDRIDRAVFIIKECRQVDDKGRVSWQCLTDTGVLLVLSEDKKICVTLYIATLPKVSAMYKGKTPSWVIAKVRKNKHLAEMQNKVK